MNIDVCMNMYIIQKGTLMTNKYNNEVCKPNVVPYIAPTGDSFLFDDNMRNHISRLGLMFISKSVQRMEYPVLVQC